MTPPIPPHAPRQRAQQACIACRAVKCKCLRHPSSAKCIRCDKLAKECEFGPSFRIGRPRRLSGKDLSPRTRRGHATTARPILQDDVPEGPDEPPPIFIQAVSLCWKPDLTLSPTPLDIHKLAAEYQLNVHPFLPILPADHVLLCATLDSASPLLLGAIMSVTFPNDTELPMPDIQPTLADIQAAIFLTHAYYGRGDTTNARNILQMASKCMLELGWHRIDAATWTSTIETVVEDAFEPIRCVWWECWSLEIMMAAVTSLRIFTLSGETSYVKLPREFLVSQLASHELPPNALRIRALSLLRDCTAPSTDSDTDISRLSSLTTIASNLVTLARQSWMTACDQQASSSSSTAPACAAHRESVFTAFMMASAALIYLHTTSHASCIFACGVDITKVLPSSFASHVRDASQGIFTLLRDSLSLPLPYSPHSPFFSCSQVIAAHGSLLTVDKEGDSITWRRAAVASNLELGEWELKRQALRWPCAQYAVDEIQRLRCTLGADVGGRDVRLMLGMD